MTNSVTKNTTLIGFYASIFTAVMTAITFGIAILTPPKSGANCMNSCFEYPYLDIASRFPRDYLWMVPAIVLTLIYVILMVCIHQYASAEKKIFSQIALSFAIMAASMLVVNYFLQVSVIQPSLKNEEADGISLLTQFNAHGIFIALEEIGYLIMSVSFLFAAPVFGGADRVERIIRWIFAISFFLAILALVVLSFSYGINRQDRFEVVIISIDWLVLLVTGILLSVVFRRGLKLSS